MSFDILAPFYRTMEAVTAGQKLQRCRVAFLDKVSAPRRILLLGEGHGRFLLACRRKFPAASILQVDASAGMLEQSRHSLDKASLTGPEVRFLHQDILTWQPSEEPFDLIASHFFLDCFRPDQLEVVVPRIATLAAPGASWLLADFQAAAKGWKRLRSQAILALMYVFFRFVTRLPASRLTPPDPYLERAGFSLAGREEYDWGLLHSDWWQRSMV